METIGNTDIELEIVTLLNVGHSSHSHDQFDDVHNVIQPAHVYPDDAKRLEITSRTLTYPSSSLVSFGTAKCCKDEQSPLRFKDLHTSVRRCSSRKSVIVNGADVGDIPTQYEVQDLEHYEFPVIGTYVHKSILPGFKYQVRLLGRDKHLFDGRAHNLQRIGMGYGKRITFEGDTKNYNNNYFYSDTNPQGYGFAPVAISAGSEFVVHDSDHHAVGDGVIDDISLQKEVQAFVREDGCVVKHIAVSFTCDVRYGAMSHGLVPICGDETLQVNGVAILEKPRSAAKARLLLVKGLDLPCLGSCAFSFSQAT